MYYSQVGTPNMSTNDSIYKFLQNEIDLNLNLADK